jgi:hypothetical protein
VLQTAIILYWFLRRGGWGEDSFVSIDLAYLCSLFVLLMSDQCLTQLPWNQLPLLVNLKK